jgi:O-antigen ligase
MKYRSSIQSEIGNGQTLSKNSRIGFLMGLLIAYIFFLYTAQKTLLPPILASLLLYSLVFCTILFVLVTKKWKKALPEYTLWYGCIIAFSACSLAWATDLALETVYNMVVSLIVTYCFIIVLDTPDKLDLCIRSFVFAADGMGVLLLLTGQFKGGVGEDRLGHSVTGNANIFSALMMIAAVFAIWLFVYKAESMFDRIFNLGSFLFVLLMMALSGGRKTILAVIACMLVFFVLKNGIKYASFLRNIIIAVFAIVVLYNVVMSVPSLYETVGWRFEELFRLFGGGSSGVNSDQIRTNMVKVAIEKWQDRPILGYGIDTFKYYNELTTGHFYYSHNNYVELLYNAGIVGFVMYYGYVCKLGYSLLKLDNQCREYKILGLALLIELFFYDIGGVSYYTVMPQIVLCIAFLSLKFGRKA